MIRSDKFLTWILWKGIKVEIYCRKELVSKGTSGCFSLNLNSIILNVFVSVKNVFFEICIIAYKLRMQTSEY